MIKSGERVAPALAVVASLGSIACCLPFGFLAALGSAGASVFLVSLRPWLLGLALVLLVVGFLQIYRKRGSCPKRSAGSVALFWTATTLVLAILLFPQLIAGLLAGL